MDCCCTSPDSCSSSVDAVNSGAVQTNVIPTQQKAIMGTSLEVRAVAWGCSTIASSLPTSILGLASGASISFVASLLS